MITSESLKCTLQTKIPLRFDDQGKFRILMFSDIHYYEGGDPRTLEVMEKIVCDTEPDLVLWGGDNPFGATDRESLVELISKNASPMEKRGIPWALTYGNHDSDICKSMTLEKVNGIIEEEFPCCVTKHTEGISGVSNYVLPVYSRDGDKIALNVFSVDGGRNMFDLCESTGVNIHAGMNLPNPMIGLRSDFGLIRFDQLQWYWNTSRAIEAENGKTPAVMITHSAPHEASLIKNNPQETGMNGHFNEGIDPTGINNGLFSTMLQRGDVMGIYFGHNHCNTAEGRYLGIRFGFIGSIGYNAYGCGGNDAQNNRLRGARLLTFDEKNVKEYKSEFLFSSEYIPLKD